MSQNSESNVDVIQIILKFLNNFAESRSQLSIYIENSVISGRIHLCMF